MRLDRRVSPKQNPVPMENVILTVHLILALMLIGVVLLQRSEGGGLLSGGGAMSARGAANALTKVTWGLAIAFIATSITLTMIAARKSKGRPSSICPRPRRQRMRRRPGCTERRSSAAGQRRWRAGPRGRRCATDAAVARLTTTL